MCTQFLLPTWGLIQTSPKMGKGPASGEESSGLWIQSAPPRAESRPGVGAILKVRSEARNEGGKPDLHFSKTCDIPRLSKVCDLQSFYCPDWVKHCSRSPKSYMECPHQKVQLQPKLNLNN